MTITQEQLHALLSYDGETGEFRWKVKASIRSPAGSIAGTINKLGYVVFRICGGKKLYLAHRLAWLYVYGKMPKHGIDHIDGNRSNNAISNLREATPAENSQNLCERRKDSKWPIGVGFYARYGRWTARIHKNEVEKFLGYFDSPESAHAAYLAAKKELHTFNPEQRKVTQ